MSTQAKDKLEVSAMPPPPKESGFTCLETKRGREVRGGNTEFLVTPEALVVSWATVWTGPQRKSIPRGDVRAVKVHHDPTSSISRHMTKLVIEYGDGGSLDPVRRRPAAETQWLAERLREALGHDRPKWAAKPQPDKRELDYELTPDEANEPAPPPPAPAPPAERIPLSPPSPVPVAPVAPTESPAAAPPRGARNVRAAWRRGRLVVRAGPLNPLSSPREKTAAAVLLGTVCFAAGVGSYVVLRQPPLPPPAYLFAAIGAAVCGLVVLGACSVLVDGFARHILVFSRQSLRVATIGWPRSKPHRFPPVWREDVADFRAGDANDPHNPSAELHAYLRDGERVGFMTGRSRHELQWIAWHLSQALPKLSPLPKPAWARSPMVATGEVPVLPYGRDTASADISIHTFADGGVAVSVPSPKVNGWTNVLGIVPILFALAILTVLFRNVLAFSPVPGIVAVGFAVAAIFVLPRTVLALLRRGRPFVVGVDPTSLYVDDPLSVRRLRRWPRHWVVDVRLTTEKTGKGGESRYVEVLLTGQPPLKLCRDRGEWDRKRVAAVVRRAAGLPGPPPEHVSEPAGGKRRPTGPVIYRRSGSRTHSARRAV